MKLDKTLLVNIVIALVVALVCYYTFQLMGEKFVGADLLIVLLLLLIFLELSNKKK